MTTKNYEERLRTFAEGKRLGRLAKAVRDPENGACDACGSTLPRILFGHGLRFYTVKDGECECSDDLRHGSGRLCKHRIALFLHRSQEEDTEALAVEGRNAASRPDARVPRGFQG